jgi:hypothetical protein
MENNMHLRAHEAQLHTSLMNSMILMNLCLQSATILIGSSTSIFKMLQAPILHRSLHPSMYKLNWKPVTQRNPECSRTGKRSDPWEPLWRWARMSTSLGLLCGQKEHFQFWKDLISPAQNKCIPSFYSDTLYDTEIPICQQWCFQFSN